MTQSLGRSPGGLELGYLTLHAGRLVQNAVEEAAVDAGMPAMDLLALYMLGQHEGLTGGALARLLHVQQSSITPLADRLETGGLIERSRDENDRRKVWLCPTDQGRALVHSKIEVARGAIRDAFAPLDQESRNTLATLLGEVVEPWLAEVTRTGQPPAAPSGSPPRAARAAPPPG
ncbi:DNA-binding MarR family transcriptional regulator [Actinoplanes lutulentus]|uniref:MarR family winged helix-turn-helix transcriptional regulator n=1 Tax=Actinoplanes lutulentus TaxID=1287878 RepID=UPI0015EC17E6|nr:MarR family transcriptional regulator [Actinoplanes lutulentus]MBB2948711.1 DNA-binding MarR family transcriptional regulator [Actinoplanes lutulentus]